MSTLLVPDRIEDIFAYEIPEDRDEQRALMLQLELVKKQFEERIFYIQGKILYLNRENESWKQYYSSFEEYVKKEFEFSKQYAYRLINSYEFAENQKENLKPIINSLSEPFVRTILKESNSIHETSFQEEVIEKLVAIKEETETVNEETGELITPVIKPAIVKTVCEEVRVNRLLKAGQFSDCPVFEIGDIVLCQIRSNCEPEIKKLINNKLVYIYKYGNLSRQDETGGPQTYCVKTWDGQNSIMSKDDYEIDLIVQFYDVSECNDTIKEEFTICSDLYKQMLLMSINKDQHDRIMPKNQVLETLIEKGFKYDKLLQKHPELAVEE